MQNAIHGLITIISDKPTYDRAYPREIVFARNGERHSVYGDGTSLWHPTGVRVDATLTAEIQAAMFAGKQQAMLELERAERAAHLAGIQRNMSVRGKFQTVVPESRR